MRPAQLCLFLQTLCSVLEYRRTVLSVNTQAGHLTFPQQPLSCSEALSLLHCWASLAHNTALLTQIRELSEKHKLKDLLGECPSAALDHWSFYWHFQQNTRGRKPFPIHQPYE